jgi:7-cyano-7-deazaguanine synthase
MFTRLGQPVANVFEGLPLVEPMVVCHHGCPAKEVIGGDTRWSPPVADGIYAYGESRNGATMTDSKRAVVLLSGGLDSATALAIAKAEGFDVYAMSFEYGQRHAFELECARRLAARSNVAAHTVAKIDLRAFGGSALTADIPVPKGRSLDEMGGDIPTTYVPARNTIFLSFALAWAETLGSSDVFIGVNALDYSGYPDCRPEYIEAYERMANLATKAGVEGHQRLKIHTPLISLTKGQIIRRGLELGVDYSITSTCYDPASDGKACAQCDACLLRLKGFAENGIPDPAPYVERNATAA